MKERLQQWQEDVKALTCSDIKKPTYLTWSSSYSSYVQSGGERPPKKPPTP
jgi:hypothetical protein